MTPTSEKYFQIVSERPGSGTAETILVDAYGREWKQAYGFSDASSTTIPGRYGVYDGYGIRFEDR